MNGNHILTTGKIAKLCQVAPRTVTKWIDKGALRGYRLPMSLDRRVTVIDLYTFLKSNGMHHIADKLEKWPFVKGGEGQTA